LPPNLLGFFRAETMILSLPWVFYFINPTLRLILTWLDGS
jgi:hypothetical protein